MEQILKLILIFCVSFISLTIGFKLNAKDTQLRSGIRCMLQGQYCDVMDPQKQCCPGTSCGVKRSGDHVSNLCVVCRDLGQPCNGTRSCCGTLTCQKITEFASVCNPKAHKPFISGTIADNSYDGSASVKRNL